jgi:hypothetical protein
MVTENGILFIMAILRSQKEVSSPEGTMAVEASTSLPTVVFPLSPTLTYVRQPKALTASKNYPYHRSPT